jgi:hypothetical protein
MKIQLQPCGSAFGRIVDTDGQPMPGLTLHFYRSSCIGPGGAEATSDKDGHFRVTGLVPGQTYSVIAANRPDLRVRIDTFALKPGETKEFGEVSFESNR